MLLDESLFKAIPKRKLKEKKWEHKIDKDLAFRLRDILEDDDTDYEALREVMKDIYDNIHRLIPDMFDEYECENAKEDLDMLDTEDYGYYGDEDEDEDPVDVEDSWNYELSNLYDICDTFNIWIPIRSLDESSKSINEADRATSISKDLEYTFEPTELEKSKVELKKLYDLDTLNNDESLPQIFSLYKELLGMQKDARANGDNTSPFLTNSAIYLGNLSNNYADDFMDFYKKIHELRKQRKVNLGYNDYKDTQHDRGKAIIQFANTEAQEEAKAEAQKAKKEADLERQKIRHAHDGEKYKAQGEIAKANAEKTKALAGMMSKSMGPKLGESYDEEELSDIRYDVYDVVYNIVADSLDNLALAVHASIPKYNPAWCADDILVGSHRHIEDFVDNLVDDLFYRVDTDKVHESYDKDGNHETCEECGALLTDAGECPKCDLGDERMNEAFVTKDMPGLIKAAKAAGLTTLSELDAFIKEHEGEDIMKALADKKKSMTESVVYPNGEKVTDIDLDIALDYQYGTDRDPDNSKYTEEEKQKAVNYWMKKTDPSPYKESSFYH